MARAMNETEEAMLEHLAYIVLSEDRAAVNRDFQHFKVNGKVYKLEPGTIRNYTSHLVLLGKMARCDKSSCVFYSLPDHTGVHRATTAISSRRDLAGLISRLTYSAASMHNVRLRFSVTGIYSALHPLILPNAMTRAECHQQEISKDLALHAMRLDDELTALVTVHMSDTVSVILACSQKPITFDVSGLIRLSCALVRVEERLWEFIDTATAMHAPISAAKSAANSPESPAISAAILAAQSPAISAADSAQLTVPEYGSWIVTMWHINIDSLENYSGEKFEASWERFTGEWIRVYSKQMKEGRTVIRNEQQEYPNSPLHQAVEAKLDAVFGGKSLA